MTKIHGDDPISPREKKMYEQEYKHGADLFQKALEQYSKAGNSYKKEEFKEVMDNALQVLNETARGLKQKSLLEQNQQISKDYTAYQADPGTANKSKLSHDLDQAKKKF